MSAVFKSKVPIQVRFNDVDIIGHVSNTVYLNYYDAGKMDYFDLVIPEIDFSGLAVVGASIKIDYLKPIFMRYNIYVETRISVLGNKSFTMEHLLINSDNGDLLSTCTAVVVCFDIKAQTSCVIPDDWRKRIIEFEGEQLIIK
jgi:acyl-CoA thioester hydrolase